MVWKCLDVAEMLQNGLVMGSGTGRVERWVLQEF